jgi:hypothetical protein
MTTLLKLSMLFPNKAPSRLKVARRATSASRLRELGGQRGGSAADAASTIMELLAALARHDKRTRGHAERVRLFTDMVAEQLRLTRAEQDRLRWAALLHDIGKLTIDPAILNKPGKPSDREWGILRAHPEAGARTAAGLLDWLGEWGSAIVEHHERFDGTGYPSGLQGGGISRAGRILAVVDAYEVMTAARSYKRPMSTVKAREELARCAGTHFDPVMVRAFLAISLPRLLWATGPLSAVVQMPFVGLLRDTGTRLAVSGGPAVAAAAGAVAVVTSSVAATPADQPSRPPLTTADVRIPSVQALAPAAKVKPPVAATAAVSADPAPDVAPLASTPIDEPVTAVVDNDPAPPVDMAPAPASQPAVVEVTSGPLAATTAADATIAFTVDDPAALVTCSLDGEPAAACAGTWSATGLAVGTHTLTIEATNAAGPATASFTWTIVPAPAPPPVGSAPVVAFTAGPVASSMATDATVSFEVSGAPDSVTCSLDGGAATGCAGSWSAAALSTGAHALTVTAANVYGVGSATYTWSVTAPPVAAPVISVTAGPIASTTATDAAVAFDVSDPAAVVTCALDGGAPATCVGSWSATGLALGSHTLTISATNAGGTASITHTWSVIAAPPPLGPPVVAIGGGPVASSTATGATVTFTVDDPTAAVTCSLDGAAPTSCVGSWSAAGLAVGAHTLTISATNGAGTGQAVYSWTVAAIPVAAPVVTVTSGPVASSTETSALVAFEVSDPAASVTCSVDGAGPVSCASPWSGSGLSVGAHTLTIAATNAGGTGTASYTWTVTPKPVTVTLTRTPPLLLAGKDATFAWTQVAGLTYECSLDGAAFTPCSGTITYHKLKALVHTFRIHSVDSLGAVSSDTVYTWTVK